METSLYFDEITQSLSQAVNRGDMSLKSVPGLLELVIDNDMWKRRFSSMTQLVVEFRTFQEYIVTLPPEGLGTSIETIKALCIYDPTIASKLENVLNGETKNLDQNIDSTQLPNARKNKKSKNTRKEKTFDLSNISATAHKMKKLMTAEELQEFIKFLST